jgi:hypothetical protein
MHSCSARSSSESCDPEGSCGCRPLISHEYVVGDSQRWVPSAAFLLNHIFRMWGHEWIYDADELATLLACAGFDRTRISIRGFRDGACADLARLDLAYRRAESLYVEAVRP